jgi:hypothetical protein
MLLIQFKTAEGRTRVGVVDEAGTQVRALAGVDSTYALAQQAIARGVGLADVVGSAQLEAPVGYADIAREGRLLPPLTHPDPAHCHVTGTGLTHLGSAASRDAMHRKLAQAEESLSDSMKMFRLGLEGGKPAAGATGVAPEWFYKGNGTILRASGEALEMPAFALDGGEETEIVALYVNAPDGTPYRVGFALGNEFSDHVLEQQNYLYLAHSKLREASVGPALRIGPLPQHVEGRTRLFDAHGHLRWEKPFVSGEANMSHAIANLEHHHFKYGLFRQPGEVHVHYLGAATLSFADKVRVQPGERWEIESALFGPPLVNTLTLEEPRAVTIREL